MSKVILCIPRSWLFKFGLRESGYRSVVCQNEDLFLCIPIIYLQKCEGQSVLLQMGSHRSIVSNGTGERFASESSRVHTVSCPGVHSSCSPFSETVIPLPKGGYLPL